MDKIFTHHCIDAFPELDELPIQDQVMDKFRLFFPLPATSAHVSADGKRMHYRLTGPSMIYEYLRTARLVILMHRLPLEARIEMADGVTNLSNSLLITYLPR